MNVNAELSSGAAACCDACATGPSLAIACTLDSTNLKSRVDAIRKLSERSLLRSARKPLVLELVYRAEALSEVEAIVAAETECCPFLGFDLTHDFEEVRLKVTAPIDALAAANELFAHFTPEMAS